MCNRFLEIIVNNQPETTNSPARTMAFETLPSPQPPVRLVGRTESSHATLTQALANQLRPFLPPLQREADTWELVYSIDQHGISLQTLFSNARSKMPSASSPSMLVLQDLHGGVFGVFLSEQPARRSGFYGTGASFLWKQMPDSTVNVFPASGINNYFILSETGADLAFGASDGKFGLWIDDQLDRGHSDTCKTFNNQPLATMPGAFQIAGLELWSFSI
eukprot:jgi/Hompol1/595/HPOL_005381-RA